MSVVSDVVALLADAVVVLAILAIVVIVAFLNDIVIIIDIVHDSNMEANARGPTYRIYYSIVHPTFEISFATLAEDDRAASVAVAVVLVVGCCCRLLLC